MFIINTDTYLPTFFAWLKWSALNNEYSAMLNLSSLFGILESRKVSDKHTILKLLVTMYASINGSLIK